MSVACKDILGLPSLSEMKLLGGKEGLNRILTWPYVGKPESIADCVYGGELLFITGVGIKTDVESLKLLVSQSFSNNLAGIVFLVESDYIVKIDERLISFANSLKFPIFQLKWDCMLIEITKEISNYIIRSQNEYRSLHSITESILSGSIGEKSELFERAKFLGYELSGALQVAVIHIPRTKSSGAGEYPHLFIRSLIESVDKNIISISQDDSVIMLLPVKKNKKSVAIILENLREDFTKRFPDIEINVGIGSPCDDIGGCHRSFIEAKQALDIFVKNKHNSVTTHYSDLCFYKLFSEAFNPVEIEAYCDENIGRLIEYDNHNGSEFVKTLEIYFENRFNHCKTANALLIHRNSLMYRLGRIEQITGRKLDDPYTLLDFVNSVIIRKHVLPKSRAI